MSLASTPSELPLTGRRIVLGITGSIAAYKSAVLARELRRRGAEVRVVMTPGATEFITPLTLATLVDHPVHSDFTEDEHAGVWTNHVELGIWGDLILVAPATANTLAAMVHAMFCTVMCTPTLRPGCSQPSTICRQNVGMRNVAANSVSSYLGLSRSSWRYCLLGDGW